MVHYPISKNSCPGSKPQHLTYRSLSSITTKVLFQQPKVWLWELGRKSGKLTQILRSLSTIDPDERRAVGQRANQLKQEIEAAIAERESALQGTGSQEETLDINMPGRADWRGALHPVTQVVDEICDIFRELGFTRVVGPEAETEDYNFTKLNIPLDHPSADMQDTFFLSPGVVLRTHTSPMQARTMEQYEPPIRIVVPGQAYRRDPFDASHAPVFEQIEGEPQPTSANTYSSDAHSRGRRTPWFLSEEKDLLGPT